MSSKIRMDIHECVCVCMFEMDMSVFTVYGSLLQVFLCVMHVFTHIVLCVEVYMYYSECSCSVLSVKMK